MSSEPVPTAFTLVITYVALLALLALSAGAACLPAGGWQAPFALAIALAKTSLIFVIFMQLRHHGGLPRLIAIAGFYWLAILVSLSLADYLTRV